jgi:hypothetical protein
MERPKIVKLKTPEFTTRPGPRRELHWKCVFNDVTPTLFSTFQDAVDYVVHY